MLGRRRSTSMVYGPATLHGFIVTFLAAQRHQSQRENHEHIQEWQSTDCHRYKRHRFRKPNSATDPAPPSMWHLVHVGSTLRMPRHAFSSVKFSSAESHNLEECGKGGVPVLPLQPLPSLCLLSWQTRCQTDCHFSGHHPLRALPTQSKAGVTCRRVEQTPA